MRGLARQWNLFFWNACDTTKITTEITDSFLFGELDFYLTE